MRRSGVWPRPRGWRAPRGPAPTLTGPRLLHAAAATLAARHTEGLQPCLKGAEGAFEVVHADALVGAVGPVAVGGL
jgi:hypothetical protein